MKIIRQPFIYFAALLLALVLVGCGSKPVTSMPLPATPKPTATPSLTASPQPPTETPTPDYGLTQTARALTNPPPTPTGTPIVNADGNVTWHPQKELVTSTDGGGDGYYYYQNHFTLFWNGTLLLPGNYDSKGNPYFIQLSNEEICILRAYRKGLCKMNGKLYTNASRMLMGGSIYGYYWTFDKHAKIPLAERESAVIPRKWIIR